MPRIYPATGYRQPGQRALGPTRVALQRDALDLMQPRDVHAHQPLSRREDGTEAGAPDDFVGSVRGAGVHGLGERLVEAAEENQELGLALQQILLRLAVQRALFVD